MSQPLLSANHLCLNFGKHTALDDVSLQVEPHGFTTIVGPNGAGKSSLIKCLLGIYQPSSGTVHSKPSLKIGYVPQRSRIQATIPITVGHFLALNNPLHKDQIQPTIQEIGLEKLIHQDMHSLSAGELQRLFLARALLKNPELLVLDEPAQNLDFQGQMNFYSLIRRLYQQRKLAVLMISHDLHLVMASTQKVVCLFKHICCSGSPEKITQNPEFISLFGSHVPDMLSTYSHTHDHHHG